MDIHQIDDQISHTSSPRRIALEEDHCPARPASVGGGYLYPTNTMNDYTGIPDQDHLFHGVGPVGSLSFGGKLDLYRRNNSEEYERASQRWADCSLEDWIAGSDGEHPQRKVTRS